jgi:RNA polymerase sigma factor (sigma-70 family)
MVLPSAGPGSLTHYLAKRGRRTACRVESSRERAFRPYEPGGWTPFEGLPPYRRRATIPEENIENTTVIVQRYLDELAGEAPCAPVVRPLLERAVLRLQRLCATLLFHDYPRLTHPPLNLETDELLSAVVERLIKALREARPRTVRQFFALAGQHMRWELNDLARRLDNQPAAVELGEGQSPAPASSDSGLSPNARRMLDAIDSLPEDVREAFDLVRIQGLTYAEAAELLGVAPKTVQRRLDRSLRLLTERLGDLGPQGNSTPAS